MQEISKFLRNPHKPAILAMSRPDPKKNLTTLVKAFGENKTLRGLANLVLIMVSLGPSPAMFIACYISEWTRLDAMCACVVKTLSATCAQQPLKLLILLLQLVPQRPLKLPYSFCNLYPSSP